MGHIKTARLGNLFGMMINPARVLKSVLADTKWYLSLIVSGLAFALFFLQTGLDLYRTGEKGFVYVILMLGIGLIYGAIIIPLISIIIWLILKISKVDLTLTQGISIICLSYSAALIYGICGLLFSIFLGWNTAISFGVTGVLWALGPMMYSIRKVSKGKSALSITISTVVGIVVLLSWIVIEKG
jgi:hypothetical protein